RPRRFKRRLHEVDDGVVQPSFWPEVSDMAAIDYATCGVNDVITHSLKLHPQQLADRLRFHAGVHARFADAIRRSRSDVERARPRTPLYSFADAIDLGDYTIPDDVDVRREAFQCAALLQNLHQTMQKVITAREDARNARRIRSG